MQKKWRRDTRCRLEPFAINYSKIRPLYRVPTASGKPGKPGKIKFSGKVMESQGTFKFGQKSWKSQGTFFHVKFSFIFLINYSQ